MTRVMYDSTTVSAIPANATAVAGYVDGDWPTFKQLGRFRANRLSIAVHPDANASCLDIENGDATPQEAAGWVQRQRARGVQRPVVYASRDTLPQVIDLLHHAGVERRQYRIWSAHYTHEPHICSPTSCGASFVADATQWTDRALSRNLDESLLSDSFFGTAKPKHKRIPKPHPKVQGSAAGGALGVLIAAVLNAAGIHLTPAEASAIATIAAAAAGALTPVRN